MTHNGEHSLSSVPPDYTGKPFEDSVYRAGPQAIPGRVQCAYFDLGGEGVAYHSDGTNHAFHDQMRDLGESRRPKATPYVWDFRTNEQVSISYTCVEHKDHCIKQDPAPFDPATNQLYVGWTKDGQWLNYTVNVKKAGTYKVSVLYANDPTTFGLLINHKPAGEFKLPLNTGGMHGWNLAEVGTITFENTGLQLLTFQYNKGNNFACINFELASN
jgi:hypothetical protein